MAFFNTAGTDRLYSGVRKRTPSAALICSRSVNHSCGGFVSKSSLKKGSDAMFIISSDNDSGARAINAFAVFRLNDCLRRLPTKTAILNCFMILLFDRSEEHTSELQSRENLVCRLLLEKKKKYTT